MYNKYIENQLKQEELPQQKIDGGRINETPGNLFDYENDYALAHWIGASSRFDVGLSKYFQKRYSVRDDIERNHILNWNGHGYCILSNNGHIFNLVVKNKQYELPTLRNVEAALAHMKEIAEERNIMKIALPRITSPRDASDAAGFTCFTWQDIKQIIVNMFMGTDFDIRIVYLEEFIKGEIIDPDLEKINFGKDRKHIDGNLEHKYY